ncbi:FtsX-like permease family protein [Vallitalea pronyensis]|uniref:FtsX-like permease family protein n=1 Tax=Vallitalea pronyensis TaxID=1348613 RepID=A0A8J8SFY0_9FIRM|nr:ABC transporter permease [Vallitalea pronyensis]QUI21807.1 FtsX-like permease family protein [Vallitalea pronyensis]
MRCIRHLSQAYIKSSKARSRLIVLAVSLSTILLIAVYSMFIHGRLISSKLYFNHEFGTFDGYCMDTSDNQREKVITNAKVLDYGTLIRLSNTQLSDKSPMKMQYSDEGMRAGFGYGLVEGRYPSEDHEIGLTRSALSKIKPSLQVGDDVIVQVPYIDDKDGIQTQTFRLSGVFEDCNLDEHQSVAFVTESYARKTERFAHYFYLKVEGNNKERVMDNIAEQAGILDSRVRSIKRPDIPLDFALVLALVLILSIIAISNIFSYAIVERVKNLGLLKAIGMTNKQIRKLLVKEGWFYLIRGLVIGLVIGSIIHVILLVMTYGNISYIQLSSFSLWTYLRYSMKLSLQEHYYAFALATVILLQIFGVWVSIKIPSRKVKKISIIESIDYSGTTKWRGLKRWVKKVKNPVTRLALTNMLNNPIKQLLTVLTICISAILFLYFSYFTSINTTDKMIRRGITGDIQISGLPQEKLGFIDELDGAYKKAIEVTVIGKIPTDQLMIGETYTDDLKRLETYNDNGEDADIKVKGLNDLVLTRYYNKFGVSEYTLEELKKMKNWCFVLDMEHGVHYRIGDKLTIDGNDLTIVGKLKDKFMWNEWIAPVIIVPMEYTDNHYKMYSDIRVSLDIKEENYQRVKSVIKENIVNAYSIMYIDELRETSKTNIRRMSLMIYIFIGMIALISFLMIFNSTYTSMVTRRKELGMLRSIGMTSKQFRKSLHYEGNLVIILTTVIGLPVGYAIPYYGHLDFISYPGNEDIPFIFPLWSIGIFVVFFILMRAIIKFCIHRFEKEAVTSLIRHN